MIKELKKVKLTGLVSCQQYEGFSFEELRIFILFKNAL